MEKDIKITKLGVVIFTSALLFACAHEGTLVTLGSERTSILRASDQSVFTDAIDSAFDKVDIGGMKNKLREAKTETAYMIIVAPFQNSAAILDYIKMKAAIVAGQLGIKVLEVNRIIERISPERTWEVLQEEYPDTDARIIVAVSYAGVDEITAKERQTSHGSKKPDRIFKGRFKASFGVTPRKAGFTAVVQNIEGESEYEVVEGKYVDVR